MSEYDTVTQTQMRAAAYHFRRLTDAARNEAIKITAELLCESKAKKVPENIEPLRVVGAYFPQSMSQVATQEVLRTITFVLESMPIEAFVPENFTVPSHGLITVETAEAQENAQKWIKILGIKFPRNPENPQSVFYPHQWLKMRATHSATVIIEAWNRQVTSLFLSAKIPDIHLPRYRKTVSIIESLFELTDEKSSQDNIPASWIRIWMNTMEILVEVLLLSTQGSSPPSQSTSFFHTQVYSQRHRAEIDYYKAFTEALAHRSTGAVAYNQSQGKNTQRR